MSKYIIELEDDIKYLIINGRADNRCYTLVRPVEELEILNSDYINEHFGSLQDEAYQAGMSDAWEVVKKLYLNGACKGLFGECFNTFIKNHTAQEAIDKLKAYEDDKHSDRIEVGDEVRFLPNDRKGIVTACHVPDVYVENDKYAVFCGTTVEYVLRQHITKTGRHFDIASILEAMRE